jgi:hypothetical protein
MNPQILFWYQQLITMGYPQQQALQYAQTISQIAGTPSGGAPSNPAENVQQQLASIFGTQAGISGLQGPANMEKQIADISMNPQLLNQRINQFTRPLNQNLINSVTRATAPSIAERGLATAPGMSQQITAEALAPYEQQNQQMGTNLALQSFQPVQQYAEGFGTGMAQKNEDLATLLGLLGSNP